MRARAVTWPICPLRLPHSIALEKTVNITRPTGLKRSLLALAVAVIALPTAQQVLAQEEEVEEIQVTGTRIRTTDGMVEPTPRYQHDPAGTGQFRARWHGA